MRIAALAAVFGLLIVAACALAAKNDKDGTPAAPPRPPDGAPESAVKRAIEDLGSDDWRTREKAGKDLSAKGELALPHMRAALLATDSPEVQRRLSVLVRRLDRERLIEPKRITYTGKNKTAKEMFEEIARQTGYRLEFGGGGGGGAETKHAFEFDKTPFWQAADAVANATGYSVFAEYGDDTIRVYNQDVMNPHVAYAGPFRFLATNIQSNRNVQLSNISRRGNNQRANEYMNLSLQVQSEPKNPMINVMQPELTEAKDEFGGSLLPPADRNNFRVHYYNGGSNGHNHYMNVGLNRGDRAATTIKSLKGRVGIVLLSGTVPELVVADPLKVKKKAFAGRGTEIDLESVEEDANQKGNYVVTFSAKKLTPADNPNDYAWGQNLWQRMELTDEKGNKYSCSGPNVQNINVGSVQLTLSFGPEDSRPGRLAPPKLGPPKKLTLNEWLTITHEVVFEFKDIPLP
jgi:hypothetical protein